MGSLKGIVSRPMGTAENSFASLKTQCGNVAAILELDENLNQEFRVFEAAPQESRGAPSKKPAPDYFL